MTYPYAHPIEKHVRTTILEQLKQIEKEHHVRILYACESGSRGWGFPSPDSDYDVRFIYVNALPWYLKIDTPRDVIECPINNDLDICGWELRKTLQLFNNSNPTLFEWLNSPIIYHEEKTVADQLRNLMANFYHGIKGRWHYLSMAKNNFRGYLQGEQVRLKKYLYVLRPILAAQWIDAGKGIPPMRFADLAQEMVNDPALAQEIKTLLDIKMASGEAEYAAPFPIIQKFIQNFFEQESIPENYKEHDRQQKHPLLDDILYNTVMTYTKSITEKS